LPADLIHDDRRVGVLVNVDTQHHHEWRHLFSRGGDGWAGRRTHLSGGAATLLSSHAGRP
jgi:hypothetical protein